VSGGYGSGPLASWEPESGRWLDACGMSDDLFGRSEPFWGRWPTSGMTRGGRLYPLPTPERRTAGNVSSSSPGLLPTPVTAYSQRTAEEWREGRPAGNGATRDRIGDLEIVATQLLPTPAAGNFNDGESLESWEARRLANLAKGINGNGQGTPLAIAAQQLLKTPTAQLAVNGGSQHPDKRRAGGHGPTLADQVEHQLLPTPAARDWKSGQSNLIGTNARPLSEVVEMTLLPTARLGDDTSRGADPARYKGPQSLNGRRSNLDDCIAAVRIRAPWIGALTSSPSAAGNESPDGPLPLPLSPDEPASA